MRKWRDITILSFKNTSFESTFGCTFLMMSLMATSLPFSVPTNSSSCSTVSTAVFLRRWYIHLSDFGNCGNLAGAKIHCSVAVIGGNDYLCPMLTDTKLSRFRRHHCSTSGVQVALKKALRTFDPEQARKIVASCSLKPVLPSSNSLSDSSTTSHSTLNNTRRYRSICLFIRLFIDIH